MIQLSEEVFKKEISRLQTAFGRRINPESFQFWWEEANHLDDKTFVMVMSSLRFQDKFPTFKAFKEAEIQITGRRAAIFQHPKTKCRWCSGDGKIYIEAIAGSQGIIYRCGACNLVHHGNKCLDSIQPDALPPGYKLDHSHVLALERHDRITAQGGDPFADETPVKGTYVPVGNVMPGQPAIQAGKETQRFRSVKEDQRRDADQEWKDKNF
jgi:hypothetical protein